MQQKDGEDNEEQEGGGEEGGNPDVVIFCFSMIVIKTANSLFVSATIPSLYSQVQHQLS